MNTSRFYILLSIVGMLTPFAIFYLGLQTIDWNWARAFLDLRAFITSFFGQVVLIWMLVSGLSLTFFAVHESLVRRDYYLLWVIPVIILFSVGAALPFYLYLRSPKRDQ